MIAVGVAWVWVTDARSQDRPHPTLVDAATTRCTVCHSAVAATHVGEEIRGRPCLDCHAFNATRDGTSLTAQAAGATVVRPADAVTGPQVDHTSPRPDTTPVVESAGTQPTSAVPPASGPSGSATSAPAAAAVAPFTPGAAGDRTRQLYLDGLHAFNRGRFEEAFETWRVMLAGNSGSWVLQVEIDSLLTSVQSTLARYGDHGLYVVKKGDLHYVLSGVYGSSGDAVNALRDLPEALRSGGAFPIEIREILADR